MFFFGCAWPKEVTRCFASGPPEASHRSQREGESGLVSARLFSLCRCVTTKKNTHTHTCRRRISAKAILLFFHRTRSLTLEKRSEDRSQRADLECHVRRGEHIDLGGWILSPSFRHRHRQRGPLREERHDDVERRLTNNEMEATNVWRNALGSTFNAGPIDLIFLWRSSYPTPEPGLADTIYHHCPKWKPSGAPMVPSRCWTELTGPVSLFGASWTCPPGTYHCYRLERDHNNFDPTDVAFMPVQVRRDEQPEYCRD